MIFLKRTLPLLITFISGTVMILAYFLGDAFGTIKSLEKIFPQWTQIIMTFTMILGAISLLHFNFQKIARKQKGWGYSVILLAGFFLMGTVGLISGGSWPASEDFKEGQKCMCLSEKRLSAEEVEIIKIVESKESSNGKTEGVKTFTVCRTIKDKDGKEIKENFVVSGDRIKTHNMSKLCIIQQVLYEGIFKPAGSTMFALLAFFVASASFRAFRIKSKEAGLLMFSAFIVMLGNVPLGNLVSKLWTWIPGIGPYLNISSIKEWIMAYPSSAAQGAILIGAMLGYISSALKIIFGVERSHLGGEG